MHDFLTEDEFRWIYLEPAGDCRWLYNACGFIVWRRGTGNNVELLHIRTFQPGKGHGRGLVYHMLHQLAMHPPYHSVYGFTRTSNEDARKFYGALGFRLAPAVDGLYAAGGATLFWATYAELVREMNKYLAGKPPCVD